MKNVSLIATRYGESAYLALAKSVASAKGGDPLAPVTVVVPSHYVGLSAARSLGWTLGAQSSAGVGRPQGVGSVQGVAAVNFLTIDGLAEQIGSRTIARSGRLPVPKLMVAAAVRVVLTKSPGYFRQVSSHLSTERSLVEAYFELMEVDKEGLQRLASQSERASEVVRIYLSVNSILETHFYNRAEIVDDVVRSNARRSNARRNMIDNAVVRREAGVGKMIIFLPQRLLRNGIRLLRSVLRASTEKTVIIAGFTGASQADAAVITSLAKLGVDVDGEQGGPYISQSAENSVVVQLAGVDRITVSGRITGVSLSDADDEVRNAVSEVMSAIRQGTLVGRCAILYSTAEPYARIIGDLLDSLGIKRCGVDVHTARSSWLGRALMGLLELRHDGAFTRSNVMAWLDTAQVSTTKNRDSTTKNRGDTDGSSDSASVSKLAPVAAWERVAREASVGSSATSWIAQLNRYAAKCRQEAHEFHDDEHERLKLYHNKQADYANGLADFVEELRIYLRIERAEGAWDKTRQADKAHTDTSWTWRKLELWCKKLIRRYLGGYERSSWPEDEKRLAEEIDAIIDRIGELDDVGAEPSLANLMQALEFELSGSTHTRGRFGDGVLVGPVGMALGVELDMIVVCGMTESAQIRRRGHGSSLLNETERRSVGREMLACSETVHDDYRNMLAVISAAKRATLTYPRGDLRKSVENTASQTLLDLVKGNVGRHSTSAGVGVGGVGVSTSGVGVSEGASDSADIAGIAHVPSFISRLRDTSFPVSEQEYDMAMLLNWREHYSARISGRERVQTHMMSSGLIPGLRFELQRGMALIAARESSRFTKYDGNLHTDGDLRDATLPRLLSAAPVHTAPASADRRTEAPSDGKPSTDVQPPASASSDVQPLQPPADGKPPVITSASRLEAWVRCPHAYFVRHVLGIDSVREPSESYRIAPLNLGKLVHKALESWLREMIEAGDVVKPGEPWPEICRRKLIDIGRAYCREYEALGMCGSSFFWDNDQQQILADLHNFVDFDNEMRAQHNSTPVAVELGFGMLASQYGPVTLQIPAACDVNTVSALAPGANTARYLTLRGSIDRLDVTGSGGLIVIDYKTSSSVKYRNLRAESPTPDGGHLQLVLYALAARTLINMMAEGSVDVLHGLSALDAHDGQLLEKLNSFQDIKPGHTGHSNTRDRKTGHPGNDDYGAYWFVSSKGGFQSKGYQVDIAQERVLRTVERIATSIESGVFPLRPADLKYHSAGGCEYCEPDGLRTRSVGRDWLRKIKDPALSSYVELVTAQKESQS